MAAEFVKFCFEGDLDGVRAALQGGVDVNSKGVFGETGLMRALSWRRTAVVILLLEHKGISTLVMTLAKQPCMRQQAMMRTVNALPCSLPSQT